MERLKIRGRAEMSSRRVYAVKKESPEGVSYRENALAEAVMSSKMSFKVGESYNSSMPLLHLVLVYRRLKTV